MHAFIAWIVSFIIAVAPPSRPQFIPDAKETQEEALARYESIAHDVVDVVYSDPSPPLFTGPNGRAREVALVLAVMFHESGFRRDVDYGLGKVARGDSGRSYCLMQVQVGGGRTTSWNRVKNRFALPSDPKDDVVAGWSGPDMVQERKKCIEAGLRLVRTSFGACSSHPLLERLRVYTSGSCDKGGKESASRVGKAVNWYTLHPAPWRDVDVMTALSEEEPIIDEAPMAPAPAVMTGEVWPATVVKRALWPQYITNDNL